MNGEWSASTSCKCYQIVVSSQLQKFMKKLCFKNPTSNKSPIWFVLPSSLKCFSPTYYTFSNTWQHGFKVFLWWHKGMLWSEVDTLVLSFSLLEDDSPLGADVNSLDMPWSCCCCSWSLGLAAITAITAITTTRVSWISSVTSFLLDKDREQRV